MVLAVSHREFGVLKSKLKRKTNSLPTVAILKIFCVGIAVMLRKCVNEVRFARS